ncbi:MAG TPA: glycoside hydrolase domain-containing protein [Terriglobales bacterium]|nr:glycoside hydrolase domain-containing protein [Terriglobales bacterium]
MLLATCLLAAAVQPGIVAASEHRPPQGARYYLGFDRNRYPGDELMPSLAETFAYTGYWLNNPPGESENTWAGKRAAVEAAGLGFLVLFNGRTDAEIKSHPAARDLGSADGKEAVAAAEREGFPAGTIIFLDQEEGGRLLAEQREYLLAWVDAVTGSRFRAGVYCSGIAVKEGRGSITTANDIAQAVGKQRVAFWVANDMCGPSPGCSFPASPPGPWESGVKFADVWQYAQSPKRGSFASGCRNYSDDNNCYPVGFEPNSRLFVDLNTATSPDPSQGRVTKPGD